MGSWMTGMPREVGIGPVWGWGRELPAQVGCAGPVIHSFILFFKNVHRVTAAGPAQGCDSEEAHSSWPQRVYGLGVGGEIIRNK